MAADDRVSAELAAIRASRYHNGARGALAARLSDNAAIDVPRLLAAVEAVLGLHQLMVLDGPVTVCDYCMGHPVWPCPTRAAITRALTGEDKADGR